MSKGIIKAGPAILSYPDLFEAKPDPGGRIVYGCTLIFKGGEGADKLKAAAKEFVQSQFKKVPPRFKWPFRDGEEYEDKAGYDPGDIFIRFSRRESFGPVPVVGPDRAPITQRDIYPGCLCIVACRPYVWHHKETNGRGLSFGLEAVQKVADGERLGGFEPVEVDDVFDAVEVESGDDEMAF